MAVNLTVDLTTRFDEPVTPAELRAAKTDREVSQKAEDMNDSEKAVKFVSDFSKNKSIMRKHKSRKKKKELEKKRKEQQAKEQARRDRSSRKYAKEMRNRDIIRKKASELQRKAQATLSPDDDKLVASALFSESNIDKLIYNTVTSDVEDRIDDIADYMIDDVD